MMNFMKNSWCILFLCTALGTLPLQAPEESIPLSDFESDSDEPSNETDQHEKIRKEEEQERAKDLIAKHLGFETKESIDSSAHAETINTAIDLWNDTDDTNDQDHYQKVTSDEQEKIQEDINAKDSFNNATDARRKTNAAYRLLNIPDNSILAPTTEEINAAHESKDQALRTLRNSLNSKDPDITTINKVLDELDTAKNYLLRQRQEEATNLMLKSFDIVTDTDVTAPKKEQSTISKLWNKATRFWNKHGYGKTEADYVKTVLNQAISGDTESNRLLTTKEVQDNFKKLDIKQKRKIFKTVQATVDTIGQKITDSYIPTKAEVDSNDIEKLQLKSKQQTEETNRFKKSSNELLSSLQPMLNDKERLLVTWDRDNHNLIINVADFSTFVINSTESLQDNAKSLIKSQRLTMPKHEITKTEFQTQIENIIKDYKPKIQWIKS